VFAFASVVDFDLFSNLEGEWVWRLYAVVLAPQGFPRDLAVLKSVLSFINNAVNLLEKADSIFVQIVSFVL